MSRSAATALPISEPPPPVKIPIRFRWGGPAAIRSGSTCSVSRTRATNSSRVRSAPAVTPIAVPSNAPNRLRAFHLKAVVGSFVVGNGPNAKIVVEVVCEFTDIQGRPPNSYMNIRRAHGGSPALHYPTNETRHYTSSANRRKNSEFNHDSV